MHHTSISFKIQDSYSLLPFGWRLAVWRAGCLNIECRALSLPSTGKMGSRRPCFPHPPLVGKLANLASSNFARRKTKHHLYLCLGSPVSSFSRALPTVDTQKPFRSRTRHTVVT